MGREREINLSKGVAENINENAEEKYLTVGILDVLPSHLLFQLLSCLINLAGLCFFISLIFLLISCHDQLGLKL